MDENQISEEVTVTPVIRDIERLFLRMFRFIGTAIRATIFGIRDFFAFVFRNFILLASVVIIGALLGYFSTEIFPRQYSSSMVVKLNVDSKEQLMSDVGYLNALINKGAAEELSGLLKISPEEASTLTGAEVYAFSSYVEKAEALNELYKNTDTALYNVLDMNQLMESGSNELSSKFKITLNAMDQTVFSKIEAPLVAYLNRVPELNKKLQTGLKGLFYQRQIYQDEMNKLDTLAVVLNRAMIESARTPGQSGANTYVTLGEDKGPRSEVNALDIQDRYIFYSQKVTKINALIEEHDACYFVSSHLAPFGRKVGYGGLTRGIITSFFFFASTALILLFIRLGKKQEA